MLAPTLTTKHDEEPLQNQDTLAMVGGSDSEVKNEQMTQGTTFERIMSSRQEAVAVQWYKDNDFTPEIIAAIQEIVGATANGIMDVNTAEGVAHWQSKHQLSIDGEFGTLSAGKTSNEELKTSLNTLLDPQLRAAKAAEAMKWYGDNNITEDLISRIQDIVNVNQTGIADNDTVQAIAYWQKTKHLTIDGKFGTGSARKAKDKDLESSLSTLLTPSSSRQSGGSKIGEKAEVTPVTGSKEIADYLRTNYPDGFNMCFALNKESAFTQNAEKVAKEYNTIGISGSNLKLQGFFWLSTVDNLISDINSVTESVKNCLAENPKEGFDDEKCAKIKNLTFLTHGRVHNKEDGAIALAGKGELKEADLEEFVDNIRGSLANDVRVQLYACNCARNERRGKDDEAKRAGDWYHRGKGTITEDDSYDNGDGSFASVLANAIGGDASVYGHTTAGHATKNYAARVYGKDAGFADNGMSTFDMYFPQSFVETEAIRLDKTEDKVRTEMYKYYINNFQTIGGDEARGSFLDPEKYGELFRDGWTKANPKKK